MKNNLGNKETMAKNIQYYMDLRNIKRSDLCKALDVPYTTVRDWLKALTYPRIDKIEMMANFFGIAKSDLVEEKPAIPFNDELSEDELEILRYYRQLSPERKEIALEQAKVLAKKPKKTRDPLE